MLGDGGIFSLGIEVDLVYGFFVFWVIFFCIGLIKSEIQGRKENNRERIYVFSEEFRGEDEG